MSIISPVCVARSENPGGHIVLGGDNVPPLVEIGLTDLSKSEGAHAPPAPSLRHAWYVNYELIFGFQGFLYLHYLSLFGVLRARNLILLRW